MASLMLIQLLNFILIVQIWPVALASVKLISGWMGTLLLGYTISSNPSIQEEKLPLSLIIFRISAIGLIWVFLSMNVQNIMEWLPIDYTYLFIGLVYVLTGMLSFNFQYPLDVIMGLIVFLTGFDLIYSSLEGSVLVTGIYGLIVILISLVGVFLYNSQMDRA